MAAASLHLETDILVVGGGIVGASSAYFLSTMASPGTRIMLIEMQTVGSGCTGMSAGTMLCTGDASTPAEITRQAVMSLKPEIFHATGALSVATTPSEVKLLKREMKEEFVIAKWLEPNELREVEPALENVLGAVLTPRSGFVDPMELCMAFAEAAEDRDVKMVENTKVLSIENVASKHGGGFLLKAERGNFPTGKSTLSISAKAVILATGPVGEHLDPGRPKIFQVKGQVWVTEPGPIGLLKHVIFGAVLYDTWSRSSPQEPAYCTHKSENKPLFHHLYGRPYDDEGRIMFGGDRIPHSKSYSVHQPSIERNREYTSKILPSITQLPLMGTWCGFMPFTYSSLPFAEPVPECDNLWRIGGFGPSGVMKGPGYAKKLMERVLRRLETEDACE